MIFSHTNEDFLPQFLIHFELQWIFQNLHSWGREKSIDLQSSCPAFSFELEAQTFWNDKDSLETCHFIEEYGKKRLKLSCFGMVFGGLEKKTPSFPY